MNFIKKQAIKITGREAEKWCDAKMLELNIDSIEELEEFAEDTDDFELAFDIRTRIMAMIHSNKE